MAEWIEESFFMRAPQDGLCVTHSGHLPLAPFPEGSPRLLCVVALAYIAGSTPLHLATYVTQSTGYLRWFPMWFSVVLLPWYVAVTASVLRIRYRATLDH